MAHGIAGSAAFVRAVGGLLVVAGVALAAVRYGNASPAERPIEQLLAAVALGFVIVVPGLLAFIALANRPVLLLPAALVLVPLSFLSFAGALLPLLIVAGMLFTAYARRASAAPPEGPRALATVVAVIGLLFLAVAALLVHEDPRDYQVPHGGGGTSDIITVAEALISLGLSVAALVAGAWLERPSRRSIGRVSETSPI